MLHDMDSGTHPNFPSPMMIHTDEGGISNNISLYMKEKMLLPMSRRAGLKHFSYNNCPQSTNSCMKKEIDHQKKAASPGKSSKGSDIAENFVRKNRRNTTELLLVTFYIHWHHRTGS